MNGRAARETRKAALDASRQTATEIAPVLDAAAQHGRFLQARVEALGRESEVLRVARYDYLELKGRPLLGRLRWLLLGR